MSATLSHPTDDPLQSHNLRSLILRDFLTGWRMNMERVIWQPFVLSLGASIPVLGLLESLGGFGGILSTAMLPVGGWLSDRCGRKPFVILSSALNFAALAVFALAGWAREWRLLLPGVVLLGLAAIARPAADSITAESVTPEARGRAFGLVNASFAASGILAPTLGGFLADHYGFFTVILVGAIMELVTFCLVIYTLRETLPLESRAPLRAAEFLTLLKKIITPPARLRSFYAAVTIDFFAFGTGATILPGLLTKTFRFTPFQLGIMSSIGAITWAISLPFIGRQVDKHGCVPFMIASEVIAIMVIEGWLVAQSFEAFAALEALWGLVPATWVPAFMAWISNSVPESQRAEETGRLEAFRGLVGFPAPYIGGLLYEAVGFRGPIVVNLIGVIIAMTLLGLFAKEPHQI